MIPSSKLKFHFCQNVISETYYPKIFFSIFQDENVFFFKIKMYLEKKFKKFSETYHLKTTIPNICKKTLHISNF